MIQSLSDNLALADRPSVTVNFLVLKKRSLVGEERIILKRVEKEILEGGRIGF